MGQNYQINSNSLILSKKTSVQSNFKMDFIDPSRNNNRGFCYNDKIVDLKPHSQNSRSSRQDNVIKNSRRDKFITMQEENFNNRARNAMNYDREHHELRVTKSSPALSDLCIAETQEIAGPVKQK